MYPVLRGVALELEDETDFPNEGGIYACHPERSEEPQRPSNLKRCLKALKG